jgi:potassium-dependent mechanosensitive channel
MQMKNAITVLLILLIGAIGKTSAQKKTVKEKTTHKIVTPPKSRLEYSLDTITSRLDNMHLTLNSINHFSIAGFDTKKVESQLPEIQTTIKTISENLNLNNSIPEFKSLQLYQLMLENIKDQLELWRSSLFKFNVDLINMNNEIMAFTHDSIIRQLVKDSIYRSMYVNELNVLETKWREADTTTHANLVKLTRLQTSVSQLYFQTIDLQDQVANFQEESSGKLFKKEYSYIWEVSDSAETATPTTKLATHSYSNQRQIMRYFIQEHWSEYVYILVIGILFFFWVGYNYRKVNKSPDRVKIFSEIDLDYLRRHPWLSALVVMLCIVPFISIDAPAAYTHLVQLPLLITLTILFAIQWPKKYFFYWLILAGLYFLLSTTSIILVARMNIRFWFLFLQILSITLGYWAITKIRTRFSFSILIRIVSMLYLLCNFLAIICNVFGRLSLSKILSASGIFGIVQIIGLAVFVKSFMEALTLQEAASKTGVLNRASLFYEKAQIGFYRLLLVLSSLSWLMLFAINLNLFTPILDILSDWLNTPRTVGSLTVKIGDVLIFILIIYLSNVIQKYMGYLFGTKDEHALPQEGKKASRLVMMRLVLIIIGFLLAIVASGLPVDKITILLGALGVGIGFGLQTIVNNLVSGIILIFEQPFQIGDYIELNGKKGIVRDIGIRASRMVTEEGTEIIMPNGDLLSGEVINWTLQNNKVRIEVPFTIEAGPTLEQINEIVQETLGNHEGLSSEMKPQVLIKTASEKALSFVIIAWVGNFSQIQSLKSEILRLMYLKLKEKGIKTA